MLVLNMAPASSWPSATTWQDMPASQHNGAVCLSFADGHVEAHRWLDSQSLAPVVQNFNNPEQWKAGDGMHNGYGTTSVHDNAWLAARSAAPQ
jgi:prepilin-type processing-associated H-X9-DG protein